MVTTSAPCPARRERMSGERMIADQFLVEALHHARRACRLATSTPCQVPDSKPGTPCSAMVGTSPISGMRVRLGDTQHLELAALHVRQRGQHAVHQHLGLAADRVLHRLHAALVGHVVPARAAGALQCDASQMRRAARGGHREVQVRLSSTARPVP